MSLPFQLARILLRFHRLSALPVRLYLLLLLCKAIRFGVAVISTGSLLDFVEKILLWGGSMSVVWKVAPQMIHAVVRAGWRLLSGWNRPVRVPTLMGGWRQLKKGELYDPLCSATELLDGWVAAATNDGSGWSSRRAAAAASLLAARCCFWAAIAVLLLTGRAHGIGRPGKRVETPMGYPAGESASRLDGCFSYTGYPIGCAELERARAFNQHVMPRLEGAGVRAVRREMNARGLAGHVWHVGHACPDPSKASAKDDEDFGWNLFAQHAADNGQLGHCLLSCNEAAHVSAFHVRCTDDGGECIRSCARLEEPDTSTAW